VLGRLFGMVVLLARPDGQGAIHDGVRFLWESATV